uniref:Uncharacterized protein n=1 Tax=Anguilla anguilla TaxID=7936 RepID=A0A0E9WG26_ANGAN
MLQCQLLAIAIVQKLGLLQRQQSGATSTNMQLTAQFFNHFLIVTEDFLKILN